MNIRSALALVAVLVATFTSMTANAQASCCKVCTFFDECIFADYPSTSRCRITCFLDVCSCEELPAFCTVCAGEGRAGGGEQSSNACLPTAKLATQSVRMPSVYSEQLTTLTFSEPMFANVAAQYLSRLAQAQEMPRRMVVRRDYFTRQYDPEVSGPQVLRREKLDTEKLAVSRTDAARLSAAFRFYQQVEQNHLAVAIVPEASAYEVAGKALIMRLSMTTQRPGPGSVMESVSTEGDLQVVPEVRLLNVQIIGIHQLPAWATF